MSSWLGSFWSSPSSPHRKEGPHFDPAMPPQLTIRNLSPFAVHLGLVERYKAAGANPVDNVAGKGESFFSNITSAVGLGDSKGTVPSGPRIAENSKSYAQRNLDVRVDRFTMQQTDVKPPEQDDVIRLTFEIESQRYRIDVPSPKNASEEFVPLVPDPKQRLTGVFVREYTFLAIFSSSDLHCWMRNLKDETPLSALSIPGTHNAPTYHKALPSVRCQAVSPTEQLDNGVRFLDLRVQPESEKSDRFQLVHGVFPISLTGAKQFRDLVNHIYSWLDRNPSETLIMSLKREGTGSATDQNLGRALYDFYTNGPDACRWWTEPGVPTLGQVRGKIVLLRRFGIGDFVKQQANNGRGYGIEAENWADNTPNDLHGKVCVQDFYEVLETKNIEKKIQFAKDHCVRAGEVVCHLPGITTDKDHSAPLQPLFLNFLSASNFWKVGCWPEKIAAKINPALIKYLCREHSLDNNRGDGGTGVVVCDWVGDNGDWDLVRCIVGMNAKLMVREISH